MLFLIFELGKDRYALDVRQIAAVLPFIEVTPIPRAPHAISGLLTYRGALVPVIDLSQLTLGRPAARRLSTRIVLVHYPDDSGETHLLGLIAEKATRAVHLAASDFTESGVTNPGASYLGPVASDGNGLLHSIAVRTLLPEPLRDALFKAPTDEPWRSLS